MSRQGKRYDGEPHLNYKKVIAVIIAIIVLIMFIFIIKNLLSKGKDTGKITSVSYFSLYAENKWGVIDSKGNIVIDPAYQEMIIVPNKKKDVFLCTYDIDSTTGEYKSKALNSKNQEIFTEYGKIEAIENYDKSNNVWYEENILKIQKDGKYGLIDLDGKEILPCEYESIKALAGMENSLLIQKDGKYGLANNKGQIMLQPNYTEISNLGEDYQDGYIVANEEKKYGAVDYMGVQLLECKYEAMQKLHAKDMFAIIEGKKQKLINNKGEVILEDGFDRINQILENSTQGIVYVKDNKCGVMSTTGEIIIENIYDELKEIKDTIFIAKQNGKYGIIDISKAVKVEFNYDSITYNKQADIYILDDATGNSTVLDSTFTPKLTGIISEMNEEKGYMKIRIGDEYKYYNFRFEEKSNKDILNVNTLFLSKKDGKYGYVNANDEVVVDYIYDEATEQNEYGYSAVKKDGKWGSIDTNGNVVIEPIYQLDNNYVIDFIGKWHLGQDINMNYYCEK